MVEIKATMPPLRDGKMRRRSGRNDLIAKVRFGGRRSFLDCCDLTRLIRAETPAAEGRRYKGRETAGRRPALPTEKNQTQKSREGLAGGDCVIGPAQVLKGGGYASQGQADYVEVAAFDAGNVASGTALDGVGASFIEGLAGGKICGNFFAGERLEMDQRGFNEFEVCGVRKTDEGDAGEDGVCATRELFEHVASIVGGTGLAQDFAIEGDGGIGGDDDGGAYGACGDELGFGVGKAEHHVIR